LQGKIKQTGLLSSIGFVVGLVAALGGLVFHFFMHHFKKWFVVLEAYPLWRAVLGGVGLGLLGSFLPLTSGEHEMYTLIAESAALGIGSLLLIGLLKMIATALCLSTGWKGGNIFPPMFGGAALGLLAFPAIHPMVGVVGGMAGSAAPADCGYHPITGHPQM